MGLEEFTYDEINDTFHCRELGMNIVIKNKGYTKIKEASANFRKKEIKDCKIVGRISGRRYICNRPRGHPGKHCQCRQRLTSEVWWTGGKRKVEEENGTERR